MHCISFDGKLYTVPFRARGFIATFDAGEPVEPTTFEVRRIK
jgi:hypothetical protein